MYIIIIRLGFVVLIYNILIYLVVVGFWLKGIF